LRRAARAEPRPAKRRRPPQALTVSSHPPSVKAASQTGPAAGGDPRGFDDPKTLR